MKPRSNPSTKVPKFAGRYRSLPSEPGKLYGIWEHSFAVLRICLILIGILSLQGCSSRHHRVPSIDIFGSYFPAWLISMFVGVLFTIIACSAGRLLEIRPSGPLGPLVCVSLILIFSTSVWFFLFAS